jgi:two-component system chemotaxis response regulator CheB
MEYADPNRLSHRVRSSACGRPMKTPGNQESSWATSGGQTPVSPSGRRDIVAIGAAMGGLSAICKLLAQLPADFDAAILIALNMDSQPASTVLQILRGYSRFPVAYATEGALVRRGNVIVAHARHHLRVAQPGIVMLEDERSFSGSGPSANRLFETCAATYGPRVIGVVLSGASHDGTAGLTLIELAGGIGIVQDPEEAFDASMPLHAIRADHPDYCSRIDRMAPLLIALVSGATPPTSVDGLDRNGVMLRSA